MIGEETSGIYSGKFRRTLTFSEKHSGYLLKIPCFGSVSVLPHGMDAKDLVGMVASIGTTSEGIHFMTISKEFPRDIGVLRNSKSLNLIKNNLVSLSLEHVAAIFGNSAVYRDKIKSNKRKLSASVLGVLDHIELWRPPDLETYLKDFRYEEFF